MEELQLRQAWHIGRCVRAIADDNFNTVPDVLKALGWSDKDIKVRQFTEASRDKREEAGLV